MDKNIDCSIVTVAEGREEPHTITKFKFVPGKIFFVTKSWRTYLVMFILTDGTFCSTRNGSVGGAGRLHNRPAGRPEEEHQHQHWVRICNACSGWQVRLKDSSWLGWNDRRA